MDDFDLLSTPASGQQKVAYSDLPERVAPAPLAASVLPRLASRAHRLAIVLIMSAVFCFTIHTIGATIVKLAAENAAQDERILTILERRINGD